MIIRVSYDSSGTNSNLRSIA